MDGDTLVMHEVEVDHRPLVKCNCKVGKPLFIIYGLPKKNTPKSANCRVNIVFRRLVGGLFLGDYSQ